MRVSTDHRLCDGKYGDNIFRILRVDYVYRLTYRGNPSIDRWGIRIGLHFNF